MDTPICMYASKPCYEPRATKDSGELHRLCDFHRSKANEVQRRWHSRHSSNSTNPEVAATRATNKQPRRQAETDAADTAKPLRKRPRSASAINDDVIDVSLWALQALPVPTSTFTSPTFQVFPLGCDPLSDEDMLLLDECFGFQDLASVKVDDESMEWPMSSQQLLNAVQFSANV